MTHVTQTHSKLVTLKENMTAVQAVLDGWARTPLMKRKSATYLLADFDAFDYAANQLGQTAKIESYLLVQKQRGKVLASMLRALRRALQSSGCRYCILYESVWTVMNVSSPSPSRAWLRTCRP